MLLGVLKPFQPCSLQRQASNTSSSLLKQTRTHLEMLGAHKLRPKCSAFQPIQEIPPKVLDEIFCFLPDIPDQLCFALCCKYLYAHYKSFTETLKSLRLAHVLPHEPKPMFCNKGSNIEIRHKSRIEFLLRLEDSRWKYCSGCWSLHQKSAWEPPKIRFPLPLKIANWGKPKCMPYAGQIDLCPCWTITLPEIRHLIRETQYPGNIPLRSIRLTLRSYAPLYSHVRKIGRVHSCSFQAHPFANVGITNGFVLIARDSKLRQISILSFQIAVKSFLRRSESQSHIRTPVISPHENLKQWLSQFFAEADSSFSIVGRMEDCEIKECHCWRCDCLKTTEDNFRFEIVTRRNLGSGKWPEDIWYREFADLTIIDSAAMVLK
ncbi:hypothetical protein BGW36DRAFT_421724 [Talaromyces proteolyticus]|uniref:F-box domain-containing protein n=1 Tax=Talaromyces proteolyticus TaxID=1131652 RepID=A0AAD4L3B7_9EURO|nr:uncharacterized protein BGW36DRAFT_421724 [Talaromyces proteolyticus]KAH8705157.1 hypothetical protein BGW36DRAFT_421724 [Talaromyces proteolyticus]